MKALASLSTSASRETRQLGKLVKLTLVGSVKESNRLCEGGVEGRQRLGIDQVRIRSNESKNEPRPLESRRYGWTWIDGVGRGYAANGGREGRGDERRTHERRRDERRGVMESTDRWECRRWVFLTELEVPDGKDTSSQLRLHRHFDTVKFDRHDSQKSQKRKPH